MQSPERRTDKILKYIDIPPIWLLIFLATAWIQKSRLPVGPPGGPLSDLAGGLLVGAGLLLMALAAIQMRRDGTTILPHAAPARLVDTGIFRFSRNPIYLGDAAVLAGLILAWAAWPSLILVPLFAWLVTDRFILDEERRLEAAFGASYLDYRRRTRRWI